MRWRLALALAYAILAAALSSGSLAPLQGSGSLPQLSVDGRLVLVALAAVTAALMPFLQEGFKELFRQALTHGRRGLWRRALLAALLQLALLAVPLLLLVALGSRLPPADLGNRTAAPPGHQELEAPGSPGGGEGAGQGGASRSGGPPGGQAATPLQPSGEQRVPSSLVLAAAAVVAGVTAATAAYSAYEAWREVRLARRPQPAAAAEPELLAATSEALREIEEGGDPRGAIVSYFLKLCRLLRERGVEVGEEMTAREVAQLALEKFRGLDPRPLARLVQLFEEARYSDHRVDEAMREEALACFRAIRDGLAGGA